MILCSARVHAFSLLEISMSTRIYNAYMIDHDLLTVHKTLVDAREEIATVAINSVSAYLATDMAAQIDKGVPELNAWGEAWSNLEKEFESVRRGYRSSIDVDASVTLFPEEGKCYLIAHIDDNALNTHFTNLMFWALTARTYSYYDNTDPPEGISEEAFKARGEHWDRLLGPSGVASHRGLSFQLSSNSDIKYRVNRDTILNNMPTKLRRAEKIATSQMMAEELEGKDLGDTSVITQAYWVVSNNKEDHARRSEALAETLPPITLESVRR